MKDVAPEESGDALEEPESPAERELESEPESNDEKKYMFLIDSASLSEALNLLPHHLRQDFLVAFVEQAHVQEIKG